MAQLSYQIPDAGHRKTILRIPESHSLYVCPPACGRRQGIRALRNGLAEHVSFLQVSQADVIAGDYEGRIVDAVGELLGTVRPRPRVVQLYVNCIDDFLGADEGVLVARLRESFPATRFIYAHINPIAADMGTSAAAGMQAQLYRVLEPPACRDAGVTLTGSFVPLAHQELGRVLQAAGRCPVRELPACKTFDEYLALAQSGLVLSVSFLGDEAARAMSERLGVPWQAWHATYSLDEIDKRYRQLLGDGGLPSCAQEARSRAQRAVRSARAAVGSLPVFVDSAASLMPFSLAEALIEYGFTVGGVFALHVKGCDDAAQKRMAQAHPSVTVVQHQSSEAIKGMDLPRECIAIGQDAAFLLHATHAVDAYHDEGLFGYEGVERLMRAMVRAVDSDVPVHAGEGDDAR